MPPGSFRASGAGNWWSMNELGNISESLQLRAYGHALSGFAGEWKETTLMVGLDRLLREIDTYLEFVAITRGR
jgi:hypothetical protein